MCSSLCGNYKVHGILNSFTLMLVVKNMYRICRLWIVVLHVSHKLLVTLLQVSVCLSYVSLFACFTCQCVNSLFVVLSFVVVPGFGKLKYSVLVFECYFEVCMFKKIGYFPDLGTMI